MQHHEDSQQEELQRLRDGGIDALAELFSEHQERLERMVQYRLDHRLYGRVDVSDILQEAYLEVSRRIQDYLDQPSVPLFIWLRQITSQILIDTHRRHLAKMRDANQEVRMHRGNYLNASSMSLAAQLVGNLTSPSRAAMRDEILNQLRTALEGMEELDREVLVLRHFEELSNNEVAEVLGIQKSAASNRYVRALKRLRTILDGSSLFSQE